MDFSKLCVDGIEAILFDMNGTLRQRIPDEAWQRKFMQRLLVMLGKPDAPASYLVELVRRYDCYTTWADETGFCLSEAEIWTRWITPELPGVLIEPQAVELMLVFRRQKGPHVLKPNAKSVLAQLSQRGYRLGVISNTTSTADLPRFIDDWGLREYLEVVVLSSVCGVRKPDPEIFWQATRTLQLNPACCAYVGNRIQRDVVGAHKAGFSIAMVIEAGVDLSSCEENQTETPDMLLHDLVELLDIFPPRSK